MKLRFEVDQAACLRAGIDCPKSIVTIDINPADMPQDERDLIADRLKLNGIDVLAHSCNRPPLTRHERELAGNTITMLPRIRADRPTYEALLEAVKLDALWNKMEKDEIDKEIRDLGIDGFNPIPRK